MCFTVFQCDNIISRLAAMFLAVCRDGTCWGGGGLIRNDEGDLSRLDINALLPQNKPYVVNEYHIIEHLREMVKQNYEQLIQMWSRLS